MDSEDVDVRCKMCSKIMATVTIRSDVPRELGKVQWWLTQLRCTSCADQTLPQRYRGANV